MQGGPPNIDQCCGVRVLGCAVLRAAVHSGRFAITGIARCDGPVSRGVLRVCVMYGRGVTAAWKLDSVHA